MRKKNSVGLIYCFWFSLLTVVTIFSNLDSTQKALGLSILTFFNVLAFLMWCLYRF